MKRKITKHGLFSTWEGADPSIQINLLNHLPKQRYLLALNRFRTKIEQGSKLVAHDDDTPGNKSMGCSWGLCSEAKADWPDAQDHTFPLSFIEHGRVSALDAKQPCPLDRRTPEEHDMCGCFYTCRVFKPKKGDEPVTKQLALSLYDKTIKEQS